MNRHKIASRMIPWILSPVIILIIVTSWFWNGRLQFAGDLFLPQNPVQFLVRSFQSWDPYPDLGVYSLLTVVSVPPRILLEILFSAPYFVFGSTVAAEFTFVLFTLVLGSLGASFLWVTVEGKAPIGQAVASLVFVINPYVTVYLENPVVLFSFAMIPWCLAFAIRGLRGKDPFFNSVLFGLSFSASLVTFPQVAISLIIGAVFLGTAIYTLALGKTSRLSQVKFLLACVALVIALNAYWFLLAASNLVLFSETASKVPAFASDLNSQNNILSVVRLLGDWTLLATYQDRLYLPYSPVYFNNAVIVMATLALPTMAFVPLIMKPTRRRYVVIAGGTAIMLFLAKGTNPPLGSYFEFFLTFPLFRVFRNPPRYFLSVAALGYSLLIGAFAIALFSRTRARLARQKLIQIFGVGLIAMVCLLSAMPMLSGEVTTNWYRPDLRGYQVPNYYAQAENWLSTHESSGVMIFPRAGVYMATSWGYQGVNIYPYLFSQRILSASGGQYSYSPSSNFVDSLYEYFYENRTNNFGQIVGLAGVSHIVVDSSIDTEFYSLPSSDKTLTLVRSQRDLREVAAFGHLIIFETEHLMPNIRTLTRLIPVNGTPIDPSSISSIDDFSVGWDLTPIYLEHGALCPDCPAATAGKGPESLEIALQSLGHYQFVEVVKNVSISRGSVKYAILRFRSDWPAGVALFAETPIGEIPLYADNPPETRFLNHYSSTSIDNIVYRVDGLPSNVTQLRVAITNKLDPSYKGTLRAGLFRLVFADHVGDLSEILDVANGSTFNPASEGITLSGTGAQPRESEFSELLSSEQQPQLKVERSEPTHISATVTALRPFVLAYLTSFDERFQVSIEGEVVTDHFRINGFANGWAIEKTGSYRIDIQFSAQTLYEYGMFISLMALIASLGMISMSAISMLWNSAIKIRPISET